MDVGQTYDEVECDPVGEAETVVGSEARLRNLDQDAALQQLEHVSELELRCSWRGCSAQHEHILELQVRLVSAGAAQKGSEGS